MHWTSDVHKRVLPNGLTLLAQRDSSAPVVAVVTHVRAGYFDEPDEWVGISHVMEHMFFKGTARRGPGEIARDTQLLGGYLNAATIYDKTVYYTVLPSSGDGLSRALDIQSDALMHTALDEAELARELEVIIQEANRKLDTPPAVTRETLYELLFPTHRMRRWRIGTEEGLRKLRRRDLVSYYESRYTPSRVIVGVVGDLDCALALDLAAETFRNWDPPEAMVDAAPPETEAVAADVRVMSGDVTRPIAVIGWRTVGELHQDTPALDVTASLLGAGRGSRLYRAVRMPGMASSAYAMHYTPTDVGVFDMALESDGRLAEAVEKSVELVRGLADRGPEEAELERVRAMLTTRWARQFESMDGRAGALCEAEALGDYHLVDQLYQRSIDVSADDVRRVAGEHLGPDEACAVVYLPEVDKAGLEEIDWPVESREDGGRLEPVSVASPSAAESAVRAEEPVVEQAGGVLRRSLAGVDLLVRPKRGAGLVSLLLHVPGVTGLETEDTAGVTRLFSRSTIRGAGGMTGEELAQAAESLGGGIGTSTSVDGTGWSMVVQAAGLQDAAELLRLVALEPTLEPSEVSVERALQASDARRVRDDMHGYPIQRVLQESFANDSYGLPLLGDPGIIEGIAPDRVRDWGDQIGSRRAAVVAVGDLEAEALLDALAPLESWPPGTEPRAAAAPPRGFETGRQYEERDKKQSALAMAFPAFPFGSPDRHALSVTATLLSGLAGRLFRELRDKMSLAYTVAATPWLRQRAGAMIGYIATSPEREDEARQAMLAELERLTQEPVAEEELDRARNYAAGLTEIRQQSGAAVASEVLTAWLNDVIDEIPDAARLLREVSAEEVMQVAQRVFRREGRSEFVVRGTAGR